MAFALLFCGNRFSKIENTADLINKLSSLLDSYISRKSNEIVLTSIDVRANKTSSRMLGAISSSEAEDREIAFDRQKKELATELHDALLTFSGNLVNKLAPWYEQLAAIMSEYQDVNSRLFGNPKDPKTSELGRMIAEAQNRAIALQKETLTQAVL